MGLEIYVIVFKHWIVWEKFLQGIPYDIKFLQRKFYIVRTLDINLESTNQEQVFFSAEFSRFRPESFVIESKPIICK